MTAATVLLANPGADLYGSDRMALETVDALTVAGYRVVFTSPSEGPLIDAVREREVEVMILGTPIIRKSALRPLGFLLLAAQALRSVPSSVSALRRLRPQAILVNTITPPLWLLIGRLMRIPVICHVHEGEASARRVVRLALSLPLLLADRLVVNSSFSLDVIAEVMPHLRRRSVLVYNAVAGPPEIVPPRDHPTPPVRLLFVGRLSPRKGPDIAIRALALLRARGISAELSLAGAVFPGYEWFEKQLRDEAIELGVADQVHFLGFQANRWPVTADSDIVLVPSTVDEPFGNVAVEAGLAARPLVVSDMTGLREAAADVQSVVRVEPSNPSEVAAAVEQILAGWAGFRRAALEGVDELADKFSARRYGQQLATVLDDLLGHRE